MIFLGGPLRRSFTHLSQVVSTIVTACSMACQLTSLISYRNLQRVQNAATRLIFQESKYCHVRPLPYNLHWLPVKFRIDFTILLLTYKAINGFAPFISRNLLVLKKHVNTIYSPIVMDCY